MRRERQHAAFFLLNKNVPFQLLGIRLKTLLRRIVRNRNMAESRLDFTHYDGARKTVSSRCLFVTTLAAKRYYSADSQPFGSILFQTKTGCFGV